MYHILKKEANICKLETNVCNKVTIKVGIEFYMFLLIV